MKKEDAVPKILKLTKAEQYHTVDELFKRSQSNSIFYSLLVLSSLIVASGLLLDISAIVIGGMILTPVLTPVLTIGLSLAVGELKSLKPIGSLLVKSFLVIVVSAGALGAIFGTDQASSYIADNTMRSAVLYLVVAITSGILATLAWARKEISEILPGIAIAVSLVPPLALIGIGLSALDIPLARFYLIVFLFNLVGILGGSLLVFSLLKFAKAEKKVEKEIKEIEKKADKKAKEKEEQKKEKASGE